MEGNLFFSVYASFSTPRCFAVLCFHGNRPSSLSMYIQVFSYTYCVRTCSCAVFSRRSLPLSLSRCRLIARQDVNSRTKLTNTAAYTIIQQNIRLFTREPCNEHVCIYS